MAEPRSVDGVSLPGTRIGRYEILLQLGKGGMARVFLARLSGAAGFERLYALKVLHDHLRDEPQVIAHLLEEAKLAARLRHRNVVAVVDAGEDRAGVYLVMEYVEGDALSGLAAAAREAGARLPDAIGLRVLDDALAGLHAAHELRGNDGAPLRLVHRDFSPHNILVGVDGVTRLTDFGIAKVAGASKTKTGLVKGKAGYMSPEQARGRPLDRRTDIWAAGAVAWELFAGEPLYPPGDEMATMFSVVSGTPRRLGSVRVDVPPAIEACIAKALSPAAEDRFETAEELRQALAAASAGSFAHPLAVAAYVSDAARAKIDERRDTMNALRLAEREASAAPASAVPRAPHKRRRTRVALAAGALATTALVLTLGRQLTRRPARPPLPNGELPAAAQLPTAASPTASISPSITEEANQPPTATPARSAPAVSHAPARPTPRRQTRATARPATGLLPDSLE